MRRFSRRVCLVAIAFIASFAAPASGLAQVSTAVAEGRQQALLGNFDQATTTLDEALAGTDLSRDDLIANYEARVFIDFATGDGEQMRVDLERIAALDPNHTFDSDYFPSDVTDAFQEIVTERSGDLALEAEAVVLASGEFEVRAETQNDPGLTEDVRVYGRGAGSEWVSGSRTLRVDPEGASEGEYYAEAIGLGGAVLARSGQPTAPLSVALDEAGASADGGGGIPLWVWIAGAGVLVAAAVVIIAVAASSGGVSDDTQPTGPMVRFSM